MLDTSYNQYLCWICQIPTNNNTTHHCPRLDINDVCFVDAISTILHTVFLLVFLAAILFLICRSNFRYSKYLTRLPGHSSRYFITVLGVLILITCTAEGILSDRLNDGRAVTKPHFYLPFFIATLTLVLSLVYYHHIESFRLSQNFLLLIVLYWIFAIAVEILRRFNLLSLEGNLADVLRFDLNSALLVIYGVLLLIELFRLVSKQPDTLNHYHGYQRLSSASRSRDSNSNESPAQMLYLHDHVTLSSSWTFVWFRWLLRLGYRKHVEMKDLGELPEKHLSEQMCKRFRKAFRDELERSQAKGKPPSLWRVVFKVYGIHIIGSGFLKLLADLAGFVGPLVIRFIVQYVAENKNENDENLSEPQEKIGSEFVEVATFFANGYVLVGAMVLAGVVQFLFDQYHTYMCIVISIHARTAVQTMIYDKSLRLSTYALSGGSMTVGHVTNHMSTDAMNLLFFFQKMHFIWAIPLQIMIALGLLYYQIGPSSLLGFAVFVAVMPLQFILANIMSKIQKQAMRYTDDRLKHSNELLQGMKLLKLYGWEKLFGEAVERIRGIEIRKIFKYNSCYGINVFVCQTTPILVTLVAFASYPYLSKQPLTPGVTFTSLALMNMLIEPLYLLPLAISLLVNAMVSAERISAFFLAPEVEDAGEDDIIPNDDVNDIDGGGASRSEVNVRPSGFHNQGECESEMETEDETNPLLPGASSVQTSYNTSRSADTIVTYGAACAANASINSTLTGSVPDSVAIKIHNVNCSWDTDGHSPVISGLNVEIPAGKLTVVVGSVGSGKSSLLCAVFGEMTTLSGTVQVNQRFSSIAYAAQKAWIVNASLRDNILFGQLYDAERYNQVLSACALQPDIDILPGGDQTEIGEKGINLSGGQKQRVSVARTMYSCNDIVLLDDPLSALDVHVGGHLFYEGIMGMLLKKENRTVILVTHQLQYLQLADLILVMKDGKITHQGTFEEICEADKNICTLWSRELSESESALAEADSEGAASGSDSTADMERRKLRQRVSVGSTKSQSQVIISESGTERGSLIEKEELQRGAVSRKVYSYYLRSMGWPLVILVLLTYAYLTGFGIYKNFWLADWSNAGVNKTSIEDARTLYYIKGYSILICLCIFGSFVTMASFIAAFMRAASKLHIDMLRNIVCSPMRFFDTTPIGRILNRLSSDTNVIDIKLIDTAENMAYFLMATISALVVNAIVAPVFIAEILPILVLYYFVQKYFIATSRELQRLDSITKSPVFAHFSETLGGLSTIRAYKDQRRFFSTLLTRLDVNNTAYLYLQTGYCWLGTVLNSVAIPVVLMAGLTTVIQGIDGKMDPSHVGLAISYALMVSMYVNKLLRFTADTEMQMNPVERVQCYTQLPNESFDGLEPPPNWPTLGDVRIERMAVRYAADLDLVLHDVNVHFSPGEKIGVCGRTGSGKSSLTLAFFRLIDICQGKVIIDGCNIRDIPLTTLRQKLAIIPQDPILFTGSIRSNLDPENKKTDSELWRALEIAQLKSIVAEQPETLDSLVSEGGENYSLGQRQLFCLARAFLRNSRVLIMDEATASIDTQTEKVLQEVVAYAFTDRTVITIAHRVSTILKCDRILVLHDGAIIENDTPENLLKIDSVFASLVQANK
ncbi:ATP-binding cassette sub-family C member 9-like [Amphiura filiformis]|uniref:ATP-binding cassette sub-family C member 9-like n=1 Tax=Amphiura filiformis TaxID=82378 RepID=UPI003B2244E4